MNYSPPHSSMKERLVDPVKMKHEAFYDTAKTPHMLRLIISFFASALCFGIIVINIIKVQADIADISRFSDSYKFSLDNLSVEMFLIFGLFVIIGDVDSIKSTLVEFQSQEVYNAMRTLTTIMLIFFIIAFIVRLIPIISGIAIYSKSKYQASFENMKPYWTLLKAFSIAETFIWSIIALSFIISFCKNGISTANNSSNTMFICIYIMIIVFKILQGIFLFKNIASIKSLALEGEYINRTTGLKLSSVFICTGFSILLFYILIVIARTGGSELLIQSFKYFWKLYLFLLSSLLCNGFLVTLLINYTQRMSLAINSASAKMKSPAGTYISSPTAQNKPSFSGSFYSCQNDQQFQTYQSPQENSSSFYSGQNNQQFPPYQSPNQNSAQFYSGNNIPQTEQSQNNSTNYTGSGFTDHSDLFGFK